MHLRARPGVGAHTGDKRAGQNTGQSCRLPAERQCECGFGATQGAAAAMPREGSETPDSSARTAFQPNLND